jgi:hypothetical protein
MKADSTETFAVLNFALTRNAEGAISQRTVSCGSFAGIERAFMVARAAATEEMKRRMSEPASSHHLELIDTEWGYDLHQDDLVVSRYWVHDREPLVLA